MIRSTENLEDSLFQNRPIIRITVETINRTYMRSIKNLLIFNTEGKLINNVPEQRAKSVLDIIRTDQLANLQNNNILVFGIGPKT